ncbi:MAG: RadC family protein [Chitinophagaceae bacterium]
MKTEEKELEIIPVKKKPISKWAEDDKPREKLMHKGPSALSDSELLAILLRCGTKEKSAIELSREILDTSNRELAQLSKTSVSQLMRIKGVGKAKAAMILAALEFSRRKEAAPPVDLPMLNASMGVVKYLKAQLKDKQHEIFGVIYLNQANRVKGFEVISLGGIASTVADTRIILRKALEVDAVAMILYHNHPSGSLRPSGADKELTFRIREAANYHDIRIIDHIIVSERGYYSFVENGAL